MELKHDDNDNDNDDDNDIDTDNNNDNDKRFLLLAESDFFLPSAHKFKQERETTIISRGVALWSRTNKDPESRIQKYWATCSSVCLFAGTAHSFSCSTFLTMLPRSAALICSVTCSLPSSWESV